MRTHPGPGSPFSAETIVLWMLNLATWLVARSLQLPEPVVHSTGALVFAQVQAAETKAAKTLCPIRLKRRLLAWFR